MVQHLSHTHSSNTQAYSSLLPRSSETQQREDMENGYAVLTDSVEVQGDEPTDHKKDTKLSGTSSSTQGNTVDRNTNLTDGTCNEVKT